MFEALECLSYMSSLIHCRICMQTMLRVYADAQSRQSHCCSHIHSIKYIKVLDFSINPMDTFTLKWSGADPEFLERRFLCMKVWVFALLIYLIFLKYHMKVT